MIARNFQVPRLFDEHSCLLFLIESFDECPDLPLDRLFIDILYLCFTIYLDNVVNLHCRQLSRSDYTSAVRSGLQRPQLVLFYFQAVHRFSVCFAS